ncbi:hypothetical protein SB49_01340 [Sediminicola sp. YIK13]|uniref:DUF7010 family protein n=1 Tax=Sediminicola sp. YIK13 TaxID=1453352 RepID=UPI000721FFBA|nr:hypothetical protein [Sediminicola sp. YIK13]ALM06606.1 hypothetical protein SB49_01340 [Sediminicola sp. YIK13]
MTKTDLNQLKLELSLKAKNGLDFILAATLIWLIITFVWTLPFSSYDKSVLTFIVGGLMLPLAFVMSKILKTQWKIKDNPLQPLGLWLNIAQLFYFPFLIFILIYLPDYFIMGYVIITGAHFFPYALFYNELGFAIMGGIISFGALLLALWATPEQMYLIGIFIASCLAVLALLLYSSYKGKKASLIQ